jgi:hypothetical protein
MEQRDRLIKLAARIVMDSTPPSLELSDHEHVPKHVPVRWWRWMFDRLYASENERKRWAIEIREIADNLPNATSETEETKGDLNEMQKRRM